MEDVIYPHVVVDPMGNPVELSRFLKGFGCRMCPASPDLAVLFASDTAYTLQCPSCGDVSHHRAVSVNTELQLIDHRESERLRLLEEARKDDEALLAAATLKTIQKNGSIKSAHGRGPARKSTSKRRGASSEDRKTRKSAR